MSSTFSYTFPFSIMQLSVFLVGSYVILFLLPLAVREGYEIPLEHQKQKLRAYYGATFGHIHLSKQSTEHFFLFQMLLLASARETLQSKEYE